MYRDGHYGAALLAYAPVCLLLAATAPVAALAGAAGTLALATVPDWDLRVPGLAHRGITHTVAFALGAGLAVAGAVLALGTELSAVGAVRLAAPAGSGTLALAGLAGGVTALALCSHVAADALTPAGVTPFWPVSNRSVSVGLVTADHRLANLLLLAAGVAATAVAFGLGLQLQ